jgi:UDP-N-acetylglucosamine transferase subunit ALG13
MIFVTVGTHTHPFNRLLRELDHLVKAGRLKESVIAQIGYSTYRPRHLRYFSFSHFRQIKKCYQNASIIISHAGAGCIIMALRYRKPLILVPRLKKFGEHVNDHQVQLAHELEREGAALAVYDIRHLLKAIKQAKHFKPSITSSRASAINIIKRYLSQVMT